LQQADHFRRARKTDGNDLKSMRARAAELHGELEIAQRAEGGAAMTLMVKIPQTRYGNNFEIALSCLYEISALTFITQCCMGSTAEYLE
jgi:hypothetical protein